MKWNRILITCCCLLCFLFFMAGCSPKKQLNGPTDTPDEGTIQISVDESFRPAIEEQIKVYESIHPGAHIEATYKTEASCLKDLFNDTIARMVLVGRGLKKNEERYFSDSMGYIPFWNRVASDAIAVVVSRASKDSIFSIENLRQRFLGKSMHPKKMVFDGLNTTSSVRVVMDSILKGMAYNPASVMAVKNSREVLDLAASDTNVIGFVGFSWIGNPEDTEQKLLLKKLRIAYVECAACVDSPYVLPTQSGIRSKRYPLVKGIFYILKENYSGLGTGFANFLMFEKGQLIFRRSYLSPSKMNFDVRNVKINEKLKSD